MSSKVSRTVWSRRKLGDYSKELPIAISQRYRCKICGKDYIPEAKKRSYGDDVIKKAIKLYMEGNSGRAVGRILGVGKICACTGFENMRKPSSQKKLQMHALTLSKWISFTVSSREKNRIYAITLVNRDTRQIVGYDVAFDKSRERIQCLVDSSVKAHQYYSDAYSTYSEICYNGAHTSLKNKSQTYTVEGVNSDLRHYIPALRRC